MTLKNKIGVRVLAIEYYEGISVGMKPESMVGVGTMVTEVAAVAGAILTVISGVAVVESVVLVGLVRHLIVLNGADLL